MAPTTRMAVDSLFCGFFSDRADLIRDEDAVDDFLANDCVEADGSGQQELSDAVHELQPGTQAIVVTVQLGGCLGDFEVRDFYEQDDGDLVAWVLRADSSYGVPDTACTADLGEAVEVWHLEGVDEDATAEVLVGTFNPDLDGAPTLE